jgi:hypothetical protein
MTQNLPLTTPSLDVSGEALSNVRLITHPAGASPPRPELPNKWREKRHQVWSAARLRRDSDAPAASVVVGPELQAESPAVTEASALPTERSEGNGAWVSALEQVKQQQDIASPKVLRVARALLWSGVELSKGSSVVYLPVGMFVAGVGLVVASGLQLFVIVPSVLLRRWAVRFARWTIQKSPAMQRRIRPRMAHP